MFPTAYTGNMPVLSVTEEIEYDKKDIIKDYCSILEEYFAAFNRNRTEQARLFHELRDLD
jgi:hypothetical protein